MRRLKDGTPIMEFKTEEDIHLAKSYFGTLRAFLNEIKCAEDLETIYEIFQDYHIEFVEVDDIPRVGIDNPAWRKE